MSEIPNFENDYQRKTYEEIFINKLNDYAFFMNIVRKDFFEGYQWTDLDGKLIRIVKEITESLFYQSFCEFRKQVPEYRRSDDSILVPRNDLVTAMKEIMEGTTLSKDRDSNFSGEMTVLGHK